MTDDFEDEATDPNFIDDFSVAVRRLGRELRIAAGKMGDVQARYLVSTYYDMQHDRIRADAQMRSQADDEPGNPVLAWLGTSFEVLEEGIKAALDQYTQKHPMGAWMREIYGIGPVISAGILAHIYMGMWCAVCHGRSEDDCKYRQSAKSKYKRNGKKPPKHVFQPIISCPTVGHIWQYAGWAGDGQIPWEKNQLRPFNAQFKSLCWKAGQSFMKFNKRPECYYGRLYKEQKTKYQKMNSDGKYRERALGLAKKVGKETEAYGWYSSGVLSPGHIDAMSRRWAVKLFLAHLHVEWFTQTFGYPPPAPYPMEHLGHAHVIPPAPRKK
jgi:hypothetical protein